MQRKRKWIRRTVFWTVLIALIALFVWKVGIPLFSDDEDTRVHSVTPYGYDGSTEHLILENDNLLFDMDPATTRFTVTDKRNGAVWESSPADADSDSIAQPVEKNRLQSELTLVYSISTGMETMLTSHEYSVINQVYEIVKEGDAVRANFSVGRISRTFRIPTAITEERMESFLSKMASKDARDVKEYYEKKSLEKLKKKDDPEELKRMYPDIEGNTMYVIRDTVKDHLKQKMEGIFEAAGYTQEEYEYDMSRINVEKATASAAFNISIYYTLEGNDLVVRIPMEEVGYNDGYPIKSISLLPGFGAGGLNDQGFILVPDGNGGVIRFNNGKVDQNTYYGNLYGWDWASLRTQVNNETCCSFPVFGISRNGASCLCMIEEGAQWSSLTADIAKRLSSYNTVYNTFTLIHGDPYDASDRDINAKYLFEEEIPEGNLTQRYRFLVTDDVTGMAGAYREYLQNGILKEHAEVEKNAPVYVELLGAVDKVQQRLGIPSLLPVAMTTYKQGTEILNRLTADGFSNFSIGFTGWMNGGLNQKILNKVNLMGELGSEKDLKEFLASAKEKGIAAYLDGLTAFSRNSGIFDGFLYVRDAAKLTTQEIVSLLTYSTIWYGPDKSTQEYFLLKPALMQKHAEVLSKAAEKYGAAGVAFRDVGSMLSSDYDRKHLVTRAQSLKLQQEILQNVRTSGQKVLTKKGFDFTLSSTDLVVDMDFDGGNYGIIDAYVPFYPMAIHGLVNYTGKSINLSDDLETMMLQTAESGAGLYITFTAESARNLQNTVYSSYYGADIELMYNRLTEMWRKYSEETAGLNRVPMTDITREGSLSVTTYENGTRIYVNYGETAAEKDGITVPARQYVVRKEGTK